MEFSYLTKRKLEIINEFMTVTCANYNLISNVNLPDNMPKLTTTTKIYYFKRNDSVTSLKFVFEYCDRIYSFESLIWYSTNCSAASIKSFLSNKEDNKEFYKSVIEQSEKLYADQGKTFADYFQINATLNVDYDISDLLNVALQERVMPDYHLEGYDADEFLRFTSMSVKDVVKFDKLYKDIDFNGLFRYADGKRCDLKRGGYNLTFETFEGQSCDDEFSYVESEEENIGVDEKENSEEINNDIVKPMFVRNFLYQNYKGSEFAWYGYMSYTYDNYYVILERDGKFMYLRYTYDDASCAGFHFTLYSRIYNSFDKMWEKIPDDKKSILIKANIKP